MCCASTVDLSPGSGPQAIQGERLQAETLVIGLGNPILGDDGVGWHIVRQAESQWREGGFKAPVDFECISVGGLALMEHLEGYHHAVIADAIITERQQAGSARLFPLEQLPNITGGHSSSVHDTSLRTALTIGLRMGFTLPEDIWIVAIEIEAELEFKEDLSARVATVVPEATKLVLDQLRKWD